MPDIRFKRYGHGILYIVGNGKTIYYDKSKIDELHKIIHEYEINPEKLFYKGRENFK